MPNEIEFSDKYEPLFDTIRSWTELKRTDLTENEREYFTQLSQVVKVCISGGRDSGKSFAGTVADAVAGAYYNHSILATRYTMSATDKSIVAGIEDRLEKLGMQSQFKYIGNDFIHQSGGIISISGQKNSSGNQTAKLKSIENYSIFKTEEAEELPSFEEWDKVVKSLRRKDVQCLAILLFNPPEVDHWIKKELYDNNEVSLGFNGVKGDTLYIHTTYLDNGQENMAIHNWLDYESKRIDYELWKQTKDKDTLPPRVVINAKYYEHNCLGMWANNVKDAIYTDWEIGDFPTDLPYIFGLDFGSDDPDALVRVAIDHKLKRIYLKEEYYQSNTSAESLINILDDRCGKFTLIVSDTNERRLRKDIEKAGFNIKGARKTGNASPVRRIRTIQGYKLIVEEKSINLHEALRKYAWHDKKSGTPKHEFSHLPNAFEYAVMDYLDYGI